ncbi:Putative coenzyme F420-dependent oxidoreductase [Microbacterium lemovicicum]|uniref:Coenzyme F420-dependent oxidoreductase n=1 Tax=Microbacterium lemovicicum TaxID=1072463 RepID=A0A3S9W6N6_9MICO|nr:LLM class flavin-dependent oxidoreductase [Microbacterium lemovicicum]AZS35705.1 Putative coenzyme F420-dependent oxidoreductase [Microbacterium lemovicicum]
MTRSFEVGLGIRSDHPFGEYGRIAVAAEEAGIDVLSVFADLWFQPALPALLEIAGATRRVRLGAACWNPYSSHPYELAGQMAALSIASQGRAYFGLAKGTWLGDVSIPQPRAIAHLRECVDVVRLLLSGDRSGYEGEIYQVAAGVGFRVPLPEILPPVLIGTWGRQTMAMASKVADEVKIGGSANPDMVRVVREWLAAGSPARGDAVGVVVGAVTVVDEDGEAARAVARREVAMYLAVVGELDVTVDIPQDLLSEVTTLVRADDHDAAGALIPDDLLDRFAFAGTPDHIAQQLHALGEAGVRRVEFGGPLGTGDPLAALDLIGRRVLPAFA